MMKVVTVVGTRPEIIRLSRIVLALDAAVDHKVVHTGQNWDPNLSDIFFKELRLRQPDYYLNVDSSSLGRVLGGVLTLIEPVLIDEQPDAVLVLGDTNSCIAAVMAKRRRIPVFHMEAGNRCFDENVPEETNRRLIDHVADFNLCYTEHARRNLLAEGLHPRRVLVVGSPMYEVLTAYRTDIEASGILAELQVAAGAYFLVSMHREENVDNPVSLVELLHTLVGLQNRFNVPILVSTHPRLRDRLDRLQVPVDVSTLRFLPPFGYMAFNHLQKHALCVLSDSGTISEESSMLGFPAVTMRNAMERPEALDTGSIILTGIDRLSIERAVVLAIGQWRSGWRPTPPPEYRVHDCSARVVRLITGLTGVHRNWLGLAPV